MPAPSVGRIVHYVSYGSPGGEFGKECRAAIITEVPEGVADPQTLGLCVINPTGQFFSRSIPHHEAAEGPGGETPGGFASNHPGGTWHWPERV